MALYLLYLRLLLISSFFWYTFNQQTVENNHMDRLSDSGMRFIIYRMHHITYDSSTVTVNNFWLFKRIFDYFCLSPFLSFLRWFFITFSSFDALGHNNIIEMDSSNNKLLHLKVNFLKWFSNRNFFLNRMILLVSEHSKSQSPETQAPPSKIRKF